MLNIIRSVSRQAPAIWLKQQTKCVQAAAVAAAVCVLYRRYFLP